MILSRKKVLPFLYLLLGSLLLLLLAGCNSSSKADSAPTAVEAYLNALVSRDANQLSNLSCSAWEPQARLEYDSFAAVKATLREPNCQESGQDGDFTLVSCTGKIVANYNGEDQEISLGDRIFKVVNEGGEWRMCGYR